MSEDCNRDCCQCRLALIVRIVKPLEQAKTEVERRDKIKCTRCGFMYQSIPSANIPPSPGTPPGNFFEVVKSPAPGQNFCAKAQPMGQKAPTPGEYLVSLSG